MRDRRLPKKARWNEELTSGERAQTEISKVSLLERGRSGQREPKLLTHL